ncbi:MAG: M1 family metallopeptidase [Oscillatoria sp. SIO1A7]|nr:M1 family metallopeptidase [Oscillatoria sp. SIO1A7]
MLQSYLDENNGHKSFELPGARPHYTPDRPGRVEHIFLDIALDIPNQSYQGTCKIRLMPIRNGVDRLSLDAVNQTIKQVAVAGIPQAFDYDGEKLLVSLAEPMQAGKEITVAIDYAVEKPQRGIYFIGPDKHYPNKPVQVWTQGEDEDSRFWFPCFDYPGQLASSEIRVRVPKQFIAISNGDRIATEADGDEKIYHWLQKEAHPAYLITLAVGEFAEIRDSWQGKPVTYYVEKGREEDAIRTMGKTPQTIEFFSKIFGYPYPYAKYAQVCVSDFIFGGMENSSTTLLTDRCLLDKRALLDSLRSETLVVHELAHQWFGDLVAIKHWSHAWVKEGMATYAEVLWLDREYSAEDAAYYRLTDTRSYLSEDSSRYRRPVVTHVYREAIELYDCHIYEKGACVYHMIRAELGDELFFQAIATFIEDNAWSTVESIDLLRAIEKATGRNLLFLFDQYVYRGGHPDYKVAYSWDNDSNLAKITITQTQVKKNDNNGTNPNQVLFDLKLPIAFGYLHKEKNSTKKTVSKKSFAVRVCDREQSFYFPLESKPQFISFDEGNHYLKTATLEYPLAELKAQLQYDPDPISRIYAAEALAKKGGLEALKALGAALENEPFWGVRVEVAKNLGKIKLDQGFDTLVAGLQDKDARVRRATVEALAKVKTEESYRAIEPVIKNGDPSYQVEAAAATAIGGIAAALPEESSIQGEAIALLKFVLEQRAGWNEVVRGGAISGLSQLKTSAKALGIIMEYTALGVPSALRLAAIRALGRISVGQTPPHLEQILERLSELSGETFYLSQKAVVGALGQMETPKAIAILQTLMEQTPDGRARRSAEEAIGKVQKKVGSDRAVKQLRRELEQLKKQNQELRSRLENLEAKSCK